MFVDGKLVYGDSISLSNGKSLTVKDSMCGSVVGFFLNYGCDFHCLYNTAHKNVAYLKDLSLTLNCLKIINTIQI